LNETHQVLVYVDDVNMLGENMNIISKNIEAVLEASRRVDQEVNRERIKYMIVSLHKSAG
jgi:hypothetical protein